MTLVGWLVVFGGGVLVSVLVVYVRRRIRVVHEHIRTSTLVILHCIPRDASMTGRELMEHPVMKPWPGAPAFSRVMREMEAEGLVTFRDHRELALTYGYVPSDTSIILTNAGHEAARKYASQQST